MSLLEGAGWSLEDLEHTFRDLFRTRHVKQRYGQTNIAEALVMHAEALNRLAAALERTATVQPDVAAE